MKEESITISREAYDDLLLSIKTLKAQLQAVPARPKHFIDLLNEMPLSNPSTLETNNWDDASVCGFTDYYCQDTMNAFYALAKKMVTPNGIFYLREPTYGSSTQIIDETHVPKVCKFSDMSDSQISAAAAMLNELIPIYNKYVVETHKTIQFKKAMAEDPQTVSVLPPSFLPKFHY